MQGVARGLIISVLGQKGGSGKSTTCENIAVGLKLGQIDVMVFDCDEKQRTISKWIERRNDARAAGADLALIHSANHSENIKEAAIDAASRYDVVLLDPDGRDGRALRSALLVSDIIYIPVQPTQPDLETLEYLDGLITETKELNPKRIIKVLLSRTPTHPTSGDKLLAEKFVNEFSDSMELSNAFISDRSAYKRASVEGKGVMEGNDEKAKIEIKKLVQEILENA